MSLLSYADDDIVIFNPEENKLHLYTEVTNYCIKGYLFQTFNSTVRPIVSVTKSFTRSQLQWSSLQKESYAIYASCKMLDSFLYEHHFILHTHYRSVQYISVNSNPIVILWRMYLQELDFELSVLNL